jgi:DNA-directed RNA polymerase subunit M
MEFCPKCGAVLIQKVKNMGCPRCTYSSKGKPIKLKTSEKLEERKEIAVYCGKDQSTLPVINYPCKKCKNEQSYFWTVQTRSSDEAETKFFKCTKCGNTVREYR